MPLGSKDAKYPIPESGSDWTTWAGQMITALEVARGDAEIGSVREFFGGIPDGYLAANGSTFSKDAYPELAIKLGSTTLPSLAPLYSGATVGIKA